MLVLGREVNETIHVSGPCIIHVNKIGSAHVRLGIIADPSVQIWRGELIDPATGQVRHLPLGNRQELES